MKRKNLLFALLALIFAPWAANAQETLTVYGDGTQTTNAYVPMYGGYFDDFTKSEFVIPAAKLEDMEGGTITSMKFYISSVATYGNGWANTHQVVFLKEIASTTLSDYSGMDGATIVFDGMFTVPASTDTEFEIEFTANTYEYQGGNLLVGIYNTDDGDYRTVNWYGESVTGASGGSSNANSLDAITFTQRNFIPKTTFTYTAGSGVDCEKPATLAFSNVTSTSVDLTWTGGSGSYEVQYKKDSDQEWTVAYYDTYHTTRTINNLEPATNYQARVQSLCEGEEIDPETGDHVFVGSGWKTVNFTTECGVLSNFPITYGFETSEGFPANASAPTSNQFGPCWRNEATVQTGSYSDRVWGTSTSNKHTGSQALVLPDKGNSSNPAKTMLVFPEMNFTDANGYVVSFWIYRNGSSSNPEGFKVYASDCDTIGPNAVELGHYSRNYGIAYPITESASAWYQYETEPITMTGSVYIIFEGQSYYGNATYVDDIEIKVAPSCLKPTDLAANATATSAELSWTANSGETAWTIYYKKATDESYTEVANVTANPYTLNGLTAATNYEFYVVANCSADDASEASVVFTFTTACDVIDALGYTENFDTYTAGNNVLPNCWSYINTTTNSTYAVYPRVYANSSYSTYASSAPNCLYFYSYGSGDDPQPQYAILPEMTGLAGLQVTLMAKGYNASSTLKIGTMSDPTDASTFTMIAEQTLTNSYPTDPFEYLIPADCRDSYLAIMIDAAPSGYNTRGVYVDDIVIREAPTCLKPTELALTGVSTTTATIGWTNGADDQTAWQICLNGDEENLIMAERNPFTIENLTAATSYTVKVRAYCGEDSQSDWSNEVNFATLCEAISTFPWTENFNSLTAGIPTCWDNSEGTTTALNYMWNYYASGHEGAGLRFNSYNNSNGLTNFLKTVSLSLPSDQLMQLSFWYKNPTGGDFSVYISTDGGATHETALATDLTGVTTWTELVISLADYAGQEVVIVFKGTSNYGNGDAYIYLDDVTVMEVPTCMKPTDLEVTATTTTTANLSWTAGANETAWQICLNGDETNLIMAESNPFTVEDLTASTAYTAKVRAYCNDNDQSDWSNEVSFATQCEAIVVDASNPFTEGFEGDWTPLCWESIPHIDGTTTRQWTKTTSSSNIHTGAGAAYSGFYGPIYLVMPDLQLGTDGNTAQLTFWSYNTFVNDYDKNSIVLLDGENEVELWSPESVNNSWEEVTIDLTAYMGQTISLAFKYEGNNAHGWYVDDVEVTMMKTFTKRIDPWTTGGGYYLIASPIGSISYNNLEEKVVNIFSNSYDLYSFDQAAADGKEWRNNKTYHFGLEAGKGYLYANSGNNGESIDLVFTGSAYNGDGVVELDYSDSEGLDFPGWNLVGNPFTDVAYIADGRAFYTMQNDGSEILATSSTSIEAMEGVFVIADHAGETITFTTTKPTNNGKSVALNLSNGSKVIDRAIVRFGEGRQLPKFQLNKNHTKVYIPQDGQDYAVVRSEEMGEMPVNFKAENNGTYTMSFSSENTEFAYLHLIDNLTGNDIDMLETPSYSFEAKTTDYESRFKLVFATGSSTGSETFAFYSNGSFVISNEGNATLQVVDIQGRILKSESINGCANVNVNAAPGVYMLRLVYGDNVKVQKVVVK